MSYEITLTGDQTLDNVDIDIMHISEHGVKMRYKAQIGHKCQIVL